MRVVKKARRGDLAIAWVPTSYTTKDHRRVEGRLVLIGSVARATRGGEVIDLDHGESSTRDLRSLRPFEVRVVSRGRLVEDAGVVARVTSHFIDGDQNPGLDLIRSLIEPFLSETVARPWPNGLGWDVGSGVELRGVPSDFQIEIRVPRPDEPSLIEMMSRYVRDDGEGGFDGDSILTTTRHAMKTAAGVLAR